MTYPALARNFRYNRPAIIVGNCAAHERAVNDNARFDTSANALRDAHVQAALRLLGQRGLHAAAYAFDRTRAARTTATQRLQITGCKSAMCSTRDWPQS